MDENGSRFLERTRRQFLEDLSGTFGERSDSFGDELKVHLFELWVRARSRPPFPEHRPEPTDEMKQVEFESRLVNALGRTSSYRAPVVHAELVKAVQACITTGDGITRHDESDSLELRLDPTRNAMDQHEFARQLDATLKVDGVGIGRNYDPGVGELWLELRPDKVPGGAASIPEYDELGGRDDDQRRLEKRLRALGLGVPPNWLPAFVHEETGVLAGIDVPGNATYRSHSVETLLAHDGMRWLFPAPRPLYTFDSCPHVRLWVDGIEQSNHDCTWTYTLDDQSRQVVEAVDLPLASAGSRVRVAYHTIHKEFGV